MKKKCVNIDKKKPVLYDRLLVYFFRPNAQQRFAADAAGAAPDLGATFWRGSVPSLVPVGGGRQRRR